MTHTANPGPADHNHTAPVTVHVLRGDGSDDLLTDQSLVACGDSAVAGRIVWWRLSGDVSLAEFAPVWTQVHATVSPEEADSIARAIPAPPGPKTALAYALRRVGGRRYLVRPVPDAMVLVREQKKTVRRPVMVAAPVAPIETTAPEWVRAEGDPELLVDTQAENAEPLAPAPQEEESLMSRYASAPILAAALRTIQGQEQPMLLVESNDTALEASVREQYDYYRGAITPTEASAWLSRQIMRLGGTPLRPDGGLYFIPRESIEEWNRVVRAMGASSDHRFLGVPVMPAADTSEAILDAMEAEAQSMFEHAAEALPSLGPKAKATLLKKVAAMTAKAAKYEKLLGEGRLARVRGSLDTLATTEAVAEVVGGLGQDV